MKMKSAQLKGYMLFDSIFMKSCKRQSYSTESRSLFPECEHACVCVCVCVESQPTSCNPRGLYPARLLCPWHFPGKNTGVLPFPSPGDLPDPGMELAAQSLQADYLPLSHLRSPQ